MSSLELELVSPLAADTLFSRCSLWAACSLVLGGPTSFKHAVTIS